MNSFWPSLAALALMCGFILIAMIIAAVSGYKFTASLWKVIFEPTKKD